LQYLNLNWGTQNICINVNSEQRREERKKERKNSKTRQEASPKVPEKKKRVYC